MSERSKETSDETKGIDSIFHFRKEERPQLELLVLAGLQAGLKFGHKTIRSSFQETSGERRGWRHEEAEGQERRRLFEGRRELRRWNSVRKKRKRADSLPSGCPPRQPSHAVLHSFIIGVVSLIEVESPDNPSQSNAVDIPRRHMQARQQGLRLELILMQFLLSIRDFPLHMDRFIHRATPGCGST